MVGNQSLHRALRPRRFDGLVGQDYAVRHLKNAVSNDQVSHAYLLCGLRGSGKTSSARILAAAVNCLYTDPGGEPCNECVSCEEIHEGRSMWVIETDAASHNSVDSIRSIVEDTKMPHMGVCKVYILDEAHMLTGAAANALLKTLEEPPPGVMFILATTDPDRLIPTIRSRCQIVEFTPVPDGVVLDLLRQISRNETIEADDKVLAGMALRSGGSVRDALSELDTYRTTGKLISSRGTAAHSFAEQLLQGFANRDVSGMMAVIDSAVSSGVGCKDIAHFMVVCLRDGILEGCQYDKDTVAMVGELNKVMSRPPAESQYALAAVLLESVVDI